MRHSPLISLAALLALLVLGLTASCRSQHPGGELLFSIRVVSGAFTGPETKDTGFFFYTEQEGRDPAKPILKGFLLKKGKILDEFTAGKDSARAIQAIAAIGLEPFDFKKEVAETEAKLSAAGQAGTVLVTDGTEYEITYRSAAGLFRLQAWNPGPTIDQLAPHNEHLQKLKAVMDAFAVYYANRK